MGLFDNILKGDESLFLEPLALDVDFMPPVLKFRENEQGYIANCLKPLFHDRNGKNILVFGSSGIGKTLACKHIFNELYKETQDILTIYINCWKFDTTYKIVLELCDKLGYKFVHNKKTDQLLNEISKILNKKKVALVLDECDKLSDDSILYFLSEDVYKKSLIFITNDKSWLAGLDQRVRSRIIPELLEFKSYKYDEIRSILLERVEFAFVKNVFDEEAFEKIVEKTFEIGDLRSGLFLLKDAGEIAESKSSRRILSEYSEVAISKLKSLKIKSSSDLSTIHKEILELIKSNSGLTTLELYKLYTSNGGNQSYRSVHRKIKDLSEKNFVSLHEVNRGKSGNSTIINYGVKKLDEF